MDGRICVVTGASSGMGRATALRLAQRGAIVVMVCREAQRGQAAQEAIRDATGNPDVQLLIADLGLSADVRRVAGEIEKRWSRLDVLVNNAGLGYLAQRTATPDGHEKTFAVNYLAPFLLTNLLLDVLKRAAPARVINVAGAMHDRTPIRLDDLQFEKGYDPMTVGSHSKLALIMFTYELARRLQGTGVTANCVHPGAVRTNLQKSLPWRWRLLVDPMRLFFLSPAKGAEAVLRLATDPKLSGDSGRYFHRFKEARSWPPSYDQDAARRLWEKSAALCGLAPRSGG